MPDLFSLLSERGFVHDATPGLPDRLKQGPITGYVGFDPTADSLHVGNLVPVMGLAWLQRTGGTPIVVIGGGTGMVGDPSGKRGERPILSVERIDANAQAIRAQLERFLTFEGANAARMRNNADWLRPIRLLDFLRDTGKHFTISYMLTQAYDFWHLFRTDDCELQMGGSDQWGNITAGTELIGRREGKSAHALVFPLITTASGAKFGKSEDENIWLDAEKTSPYKFYQFWLNTDDRDLERCLKFFTFLSLEEIRRLMDQQAGDPGQRAAHRLLAEELTSRVHGADTARRVVAASRLLFGGQDLRAAEATVFQTLADEIPTLRMTRAEVEGLPVIDLLVKAGLASSKSDARRGIQGKGFSLNAEPVSDVDRILGEADLLAGGHAMLQKGKKNYALLIAES